MARQESFEVEIPGAGASVAGTLWLPPASANGGEIPAVLICPDPLRPDQIATSLAEELGSSLVAGGLAAATYRPRASHSPVTIDGLVDEASAVFRTIMLRADVDGDRIGVLGIGVGAMIASGLGARTEAVTRLCLINAATPDDLARRAREAKSAREDRPDQASLARLAELIDSMAETDPLSDAAARSRPILILHGAADRSVPLASGDAYAARVREANHPVESLIVARGDHDLGDTSVRATVLSRVRSFFTAMVAVTATSAGA